jgi:hypothetical protein
MVVPSPSLLWSSHMARCRRVSSSQSHHWGVHGLGWPRCNCLPVAVMVVVIAVGGTRGTGPRGWVALSPSLLWSSLGHARLSTAAVECQVAAHHRWGVHSSGWPQPSHSPLRCICRSCRHHHRGRAWHYMGGSAIVTAVVASEQVAPALSHRGPEKEEKTQGENRTHQAQQRAAPPPAQQGIHSSGRLWRSTSPL